MSAPAATVPSATVADNANKKQQGNRKKKEQPAAATAATQTSPPAIVAASSNASTDKAAATNRNNKQKQQKEAEKSSDASVNELANALSTVAVSDNKRGNNKKQQRSKTASDSNQASSSPPATASPEATKPTQPPRPRTAAAKATTADVATSPTSPSAAATAPTRKPMAHRPNSAAPTTTTSSNSNTNNNNNNRAPVPVASPTSILSAPPAQLHAPASTRDIIVLKVGSASLSADDCKLLHLSNICNLVETICTLKQQGFQVILVTSGAVAVGCQRLGLTSRPKELVTKQAVAAIGQSRLMRVYDDLFSAMSQPIAQVLLTRENLSKHHHYVNALNTFRELLRIGVVPIVNENDTVAVEELKVGDNDTLSALVASLVQAKWLFLLTDVAGLYDSDPRSNPNAKIINTVKEIESLNVSLGSSGSIGTGGMTTKLVAATIATQAGVHTGIIKSTDLQNIGKMMKGEAVGTHFLPSHTPLRAHKKWIAHGLTPEGGIVLDQGAAQAILEKKSLFAKGVVGVTGNFRAGASVRLLRANVPPAASPTPNSSASSSVPRARVYSSAECASFTPIAVGVVHYSSEEIIKLAGLHSSLFAEALGYETLSEELAHREDIVITLTDKERKHSVQQTQPMAPAVAVVAASQASIPAGEKTPRQRREKKQKQDNQQTQKTPSVSPPASVSTAVSTSASASPPASSSSSESTSGNNRKPRGKKANNNDASTSAAAVTLSPIESESIKSGNNNRRNDKKQNTAESITVSNSASQQKSK